MLNHECDLQAVSYQNICCRGLLSCCQSTEGTETTARAWVTMDVSLINNCNLLPIIFAANCVISLHFKGIILLFLYVYLGSVSKFTKILEEFEKGKAQGQLSDRREALGLCPLDPSLTWKIMQFIPGIQWSQYQSEIAQT